MYVHCTFQWNGTLYMKCVYYILLECVTWSIGFDQILPKHNLWQYVDAEWHKWPSVGVMLCKTYVCLFLSIFIFSLFFYANDVDYLYEEPMENVHLKPQASQLETYGKKCINVASCLNIACIAFLSQALSQRNARLYTRFALEPRLTSKAETTGSLSTTQRSVSIATMTMLRYDL